MPARIAIAVVAVAIVGTATYVALTRGGTTPAVAPPAGGPSPVPTPPRVAFIFPLSKTASVSTGGGGGDAAQRIAVRIQTTLSSFYDTAFLDPSTWANGLSDDAWDAFEGPLRPQARKDSDSLTLGEEGAAITSLESTKASLTIKLLFDPKGRPEAGVADVEFKATGTLTDGEGVRVTNRASFILRPFGDRWLIVGYPSATTNIRSVPPADASPSPTATP